MEFKHNRQQIVRAAITSLKIQPKDYSIPSFLADSQAQKMLDRHRADFNNQITKIQKRLERALTHPTQNDPVYQVAQRMFTSDLASRLDRDDDVKYKIRDKAERRFLMGYPPRKAADSSYGDPINWEWIVHVAEEKKARIVIVSRDSDYGVSYKSRPTLNDWLLQEFRDRVSKKGKILLTNRLTVAYKEAGIPVTKKESEQELSFVRERDQDRSTALNLEAEDYLAGLSAQNLSRLLALDLGKRLRDSFSGLSLSAEPLGALGSAWKPSDEAAAEDDEDNGEH